MELTDLKVFIEVARNQSISRAAAGMHMGQPAVSQRIAQLEREFGHELFTRHRRGVRLTEAGSIWLDYAERVMGLIDEGLVATRQVGGAAVPIRLAGPSSLNGYFLPPLLADLSQAGHSVVLRDAHSHEVMQSVLDGTVDAGFVLGVPAPPGTKSWLVHRDPIVCVAASHHPLVETMVTAKLYTADLLPHRLVFYPFSYDYKALVRTIETICDRPSHGVVETTPVESVKALLRAGDCVSFVPLMTIHSELSRNEFVVLPIVDLPDYHWEIAITYRDRKILSSATSAVLASVKRLWMEHQCM